MKPLLYGAAFGVGYHLAVLLIEHPWSASLLNYAKEEVAKKAFKKGLKSATTATAEVSGVVK